MIERREAHGELEREKSVRVRAESERLDPRTGIPDHYTTFAISHTLQEILTKLLQL